MILDQNPLITFETWDISVTKQEFPSLGMISNWDRTTLTPITSCLGYQLPKGREKV